ncbi:protein FAM200A-like [Onthophagus taurus]|uniref:protein FAM200A-like n=1 Tax=Onthophagus taurus TaxID=166361 RepID=UPI0039BDC59E
MSKFTEESKCVTEVSFKIAWIIARAKRPYTEGDFIKQNIIDTIKSLDTNNTKLLKLIGGIPVSRHTVERRIAEITVDLLSQLHKDIKNCVAFSLALDESTDITDQPQLAIFIRFVFEDGVTREELLDLIALKDTTRGIDIKEAFDAAVKDIPKNKLTSIATDGAAAMVGKKMLD